MSYDYEIEKRKLFTEDGLKEYTKMRDQIKRILDDTGAFAFYGLKNTGDAWFTQACLDYMIQQGELVCLRGEQSAWLQFQVYATPKVHNR